MRINKYKNIQTVTGGHVFDSKKESERYLELRQWQKEGKIRYLALQPEYTLLEAFFDNQGKKHRPITYSADFEYVDMRHGFTVEDVKGMKTEVYKIKKKLFLSKFKDIRFIES